MKRRSDVFKEAITNGYLPQFLVARPPVNLLQFDEEQQQGYEYKSNSENRWDGSDCYRIVQE